MLGYPKPRKMTEPQGFEDRASIDERLRSGRHRTKYTARTASIMMAKAVMAMWSIDIVLLPSSQDSLDRG